MGGESPTLLVSFHGFQKGVSLLGYIIYDVCSADYIGSRKFEIGTGRVNDRNH